MIRRTDFERFTDDIAQHTMTVQQDDGLRRHLRFRRGGSYTYAFDLITWPGFLCYTGDMGTYVFSRLPDMFEFFRARGERGECLDFQYWAEKAVASDKADGLKEFSEAKFTAHITEDLAAFIANHDIGTAEEEELRNDVKATLLSDPSEQAIGEAIHFQWGREHVFPDFWENDCRAYVPRFIWCCYALQWAIETYDAAPKRCEQGPADLHIATR